MVTNVIIYIVSGSLGLDLREKGLSEEIDGVLGLFEVGLGQGLRDGEGDPLLLQVGHVLVLVLEQISDQVRSHCGRCHIVILNILNLFQNRFIY